MAELTRDETRYYHLSDVEEYPVAAGVTVYEGAAVGENGSGYARPLIAGDPFLGFASKRVSNSSGVAGAERVQVKTNGLVKLLVAGVTIIDNKGTEVYAINDGTFTVSASGVKIGKIHKVESNGYALVRIEVASAAIWNRNTNENLVNVSPLKTASANTAAINAALLSGGVVRVIGQSVCLINDTLILHNDTHLIIDAGLTIKMDAVAHRHMLATSGIVNKSTTGDVVTIAWTQDLLATVTHTAHNKSVGDYVWFDGANQAQFNSVLRVVSVTNANTYTVLLDRQPTTTATGTITARTPNKNITVEINGIFDYDSATKTSALPFDLLCVVLSGVNINVTSGYIKNAAKYCVALGAVRNCSVKNVEFGVTGSDGLKLYGPAFNIDIENISGYSNDDFVSIQPHEPAAFMHYMWSTGDIINVNVKGLMPINTNANATIALYPSELGEYIDRITIDNVDSFNRISFTRGQFTSETFIGNVTISNVKAPYDKLNGFGGIRVSAGVNIKNLTLLKITGSYKTDDYLDILATATVQLLTVEKCSFISESNYLIANAGTIGSITVRDCTIVGSGAGGRVVKNEATINLIHLTNNHLSEMGFIVNQMTGSNDGVKIILDNNIIVATLTHAGIVTLIGAATVIFKSNIVTFGTKGLVTINSTGKLVSVITDGNKFSYLAGGVLFVNTGSTSLIAMNGTDIPVVLSELTRTVPGQIVKAKTSLGTVLLNEIVVNDTTNAAGSWHQLSNPALVY